MLTCVRVSLAAQPDGEHVLHRTKPVSCSREFLQARLPQVSRRNFHVAMLSSRCPPSFPSPSFPLLPRPPSTPSPPTPAYPWAVACRACMRPARRAHGSWLSPRHTVCNAALLLALHGGNPARPSHQGCRAASRPCHTTRTAPTTRMLRRREGRSVGERAGEVMRWRCASTASRHASSRRSAPPPLRRRGPPDRARRLQQGAHGRRRPLLRAALPLASARARPSTNTLPTYAGALREEAPKTATAASFGPR